MRAVDIIVKVRDHQELTSEEIQFFVKGIADGSIPDYQITAWAMAVLLNGLSDRETTDLTLAMAHSGDVLDLSKEMDVVVDKHSTGGVGDKVTLVVEPVVAACGLRVGKMSGRGLGFSGGTLDKLESIPGYRTDLSKDEFLQQLRSIGIVLTGQTGDMAPADGKLYALRDVTGTVQSIPLIASSVMSKKIAAGAQAIVLDVKVGYGAFMRDVPSAARLSHLMVSIGKLSGRKVTAILSDMNQPLGHGVGNVLEVREAIETLHGRGPADFREHVLLVASHILVLAGKCPDLCEAKAMAEDALDSGKAWEMFRKLVHAQGGDVEYIDHPEKMANAPLIETVRAPKAGHIAEINAQVVGEVSVLMGAGRAKKGDPIDHAVGMVVLRKVGDHVEKGDALFEVHAHDQATLELAKREVLAAFKWSAEPVKPLPLYYDIITQ
jgi:pyrimidine-nucleoside phosphorylase